jgi:hypothetical protein
MAARKVENSYTLDVYFARYFQGIYIYIYIKLELNCVFIYKKYILS